MAKGYVPLSNLWNRNSKNEHDRMHKELYEEIKIANDLKIGIDDIEYESARKANEMVNVKQLDRINNNSKNLDIDTKYIDLDWSLGSIDELTGIVNNGAWSVKMHTKFIELSNGEMIITKTTNENSAVCFYYKNGAYVRNSGYFVGERRDPKNDDFNQIIVMTQYRNNTVIDSADLFLSLVNLISISKESNITNREKIENIDKSLGITPIIFDYGKVINIPDNYGKSVNLIATNNGQWKTAIVDCGEGDIFLISGNGGIAPRLWSFIDSNNKVISMSKSSLEFNNKYIVAPPNSKKMIINDQSNSSSFKVDKSVYKNEISFDEDTMSVGEIHIGSVGIGSRVDLTLKYNTNFSSLVVPVDKRLNIFLDGLGGSNPRFYGWLDSELRLLEMSNEEEISQHVRELKKPPSNAAYLVFNSNLQTRYRPKMSYLNNDAFVTTYRENSNSEKQRMIPTTMQMTDFINGISFRKELNSNLLNFYEAGDEMAHSSSFRIIDDIVYSTFYINTIRNHEDSKQLTQVLRVRNLDGTGELENYTICKIGDTLFGEKVTQLYDTVIIDELGDIRILFVAFFGGQWHQLFKIFNKDTKTFSEPKKMYFTYKENKEEFTTNGIKNILKAYNIYYPNFDRHANFMQKVSYRIENGEKYWYIGLGMKDFCFIAKTKDFINVEYVAQPSFEHTPQYEASVYVLGNEVFYFERQAMWETTTYSLLSKYNLISGEWAKPVKVNDCQSRSDFLYFNDILYLIHAPFNRNHISIMEINQENLEMSYDIQTANTNNLIFPFAQIYKNKLYLSATERRKRIVLSEFSIDKYDVNSVIDMFEKLIN